MLTKKDRQLIEKARRQRWEEIIPEDADTPEAAEILHDIAVRKYHNEEARMGII